MSRLVELQGLEEYLKASNYDAFQNRVEAGVQFRGLVRSLSHIKESEIEEWMEWHDKWEAMDERTQDSYLILLALKGNNGLLHDQ